MNRRLLSTVVLVILLAGCAYIPGFKKVSEEERLLAEAGSVLADAKTARDRTPDANTERKLTIAQKAFEDKALVAAEQQRKAGQWFQAQAVLDQSLQQLPASKRLLQAKQEIEAERRERLVLSDCRLGAARARYLADKADLLKTRAPLEAKDYLQDWLSRRERSELDQLGEQLRECAGQALASRQLELAEETIVAAGRARGEEFIAIQRTQLESLRKPPPNQAPKRVIKEVREPSVTPQQLIRQQRVALQSAMTRGNLKQAKTALDELRKLEGDTPQLKDLGQSIDEAIAAYIAEVNERASVHYRDRQIEQARDLWQEILNLDPNNAQARVNLDRAERVLKKLEELQGTSPEVPPETGSSNGQVSPSAAKPATPVTAPLGTTP